MFDLNKHFKRDAILIVGLLTSILFIMGAGAPAVVTPWYMAINWGTIITTVVGTGGLFAVIKYILDFRLGSKAADNSQEKVYMDASEKLRKELQEMIDILKSDVEALRKRVITLEKYITDNNLPIPGSV